MGGRRALVGVLSPCRRKFYIRQRGFVSGYGQHRLEKDLEYCGGIRRRLRLLLE